MLNEHVFRLLRKHLQPSFKYNQGIDVADENT